ncbi:MAG: hypothetical protein MJ166_11090 [Clostridia bacterium]|nr:hypothetical protein [Clostridia bacterium]
MSVEKEPFDRDAFARMYPNSNGPKRYCEFPREVVEKTLEAHEELYYKLDEVHTIAEFVELMDKWDASAL